MSNTQKMSHFLHEKAEEVKMAEALKRLRNNSDFKLIIGEGFFEKDAIRCVALKAQVAMRNPALQLSISNRIDAIGELNVYLQNIDVLGNAAVAAIHEAENLPDLEDDQEYEVNNEAE